MNKIAKESIINTLRRAKGRSIVGSSLGEKEKWVAPSLSKEESLNRLCQCLEKAFTQVEKTTEANLVQTLKHIIETHNITTLAHGIGTWIEPILKDSSLEKATTFIPVTDAIEVFKEKLFTVDAGITSTKGAIAENGTILIHSSASEPRTLSLVPPIHIAIVRASEVYSSLLDAIQEQQWDSSLPTNVVLISSPSRTADIELVIAMGVHGPKKLIVVIVE